MSLFDEMQEATFSTTEKVFGDVASWTPSNDTIAQSATVLFKNPNDPINLGQIDKFAYRPYDYSFEYFTGQFPNLKELVEAGVVQQVTVKDYLLAIREIRATADGKTFIAFGELITND